MESLDLSIYWATAVLHTISSANVVNRILIVNEDLFGHV